MEKINLIYIWICNAYCFLFKFKVKIKTGTLSLFQPELFKKKKMRNRGIRLGNFITCLLEAIFQVWFMIFREYSQAHIRLGLWIRIAVSQFEYCQKSIKVLNDATTSELLPGLSITVTEAPLILYFTDHYEKMLFQFWKFYPTFIRKYGTCWKRTHWKKLIHGYSCREGLNVQPYTQLSFAQMALNRIKMVFFR
jgi:hypothetical protein